MAPPGETSRARRCRTRATSAPPFRFIVTAPTRARNMSLIVKICGLSTRETLDVALDAGADMVGFVFFPPSPRHLSLETARELGGRVKRRAVKVALTVDADDMTLGNIVEALQPDILQLHGKETVARLRDIRQTFGLPVMKAIAVETAADLASLPGYAAAADRILFDARAPKGATRPGGLGAVFDWHVLEKLDLKLPFMVSGGLTAENVAEAARVTRAGGVDVSSGVEGAPGVKDPEMIRAFIRSARIAEQDTALAVAGGR
jgi:phosphoribosylanthranilate isomerase